MLLDDALADRETQACPLADLLGGEEGIEDLGQMLQCDAAAVVGHGELDDLAAVSSAVPRLDEVGGNPHLSIAFNRVEGIGEEVQEELLKHLGIGPQLDRFGEGADDDPLVRRGGLPLGYLFAKSGTPVIEDAIGVVRGARRRERARAFVEYVGGVEAQLLATREAYRLPARLDLPADSLPPWVREVRRVMQAADVDWDVLAERGAEWMRYWDQNVRGKGRQ